MCLHCFSDGHEYVPSFGSDFTIGFVFKLFGFYYKKNLIIKKNKLLIPIKRLSNTKNLYITIENKFGCRQRGSVRSVRRQSSR